MSERSEDPYRLSDLDRNLRRAQSNAGSTRHRSPEGFMSGKAYLTRAEAAEYISVSLSTIDTLRAKREIPFSRVTLRPGARGTPRFKRADLDAFMERVQVQS